MIIEEWIYLLECGLISAAYYLLLSKFYLKKTFTYKDFTVYLVLGFFIAWGLDIIERQSEMESYVDVLKVGLGTWLLFVAPFGIRKWWKKEISKQDFKIEYGIELINYLIIASLLYYLS